MQRKLIVLGLGVFGIAILWLTNALAATDTAARPVYEYVTIRWGGRDNTHIIRPGGKVEHIGTELRKFSKPNATDERSFYMNAAMNGLSKEGYEFAGMTPDDIVMKRSVTQ